MLENGALLFNRVGGEGFETNCGFSIVTILPIYLFSYLSLCKVMSRGFRFTANELFVFCCKAV
ncbi:hypothetical protein VCR29J2_700122 [Vibrio coralliirubri]|nr:hypothetical protein VCR29J2_700122 [Vibrio coralliirubri]